MAQRCAIVGAPVTDPGAPTLEHQSMRVLVVGRSVLPFGPEVGGAELAGYYLATSLAELGHEVHLVADVGDLSELPAGVMVHDISTWYKRAISRTYGSFTMWLIQHLVANLLAARTARAVLRRKRYDFDLIHGCSNLATLLLCLSRCRIPVVYAEHDPGPWQGRYEPALECGIRKCVFRTLDVEVFRCADHTIFLDEAGESEAVTKWRVPRAKVSTIPNGVDVELFSPRSDGDEVEEWPNLAPGYCLYVGSLTSRKRVDQLLKALTGIDVPCVIAGDGPLRNELQLLAEELGLSGRVMFLGSVPRVQLPEVYRRAAMLVLPSHAEAMPFALLEAMACGTPPVATAVYGIPRVVQDGHNGFLVEPGDIEGLRTTIGQLAADEVLRAELGQNARATVVRDFTWAAHAREVERVYETLLRHRSPCREAQE